MSPTRARGTTARVPGVQNVRSANTASRPFRLTGVLCALPWRDVLRGQLLDVQNIVVAAAAAAATPRAADPPTDDVERPSISYIRDSVIALRQFDILRGELAMSWKPSGRPAGSPLLLAPPLLDATATFLEMAVRLFGAEKLTDDAHRPELRDRFSELAEALGNTVVDNVNTSHPGGVTLGKRAIKFVTWVIHVISGFIVRKLLTPKEKSHPVKTWMIASGLAFVAAAGVVGFVRNRAAFIIGAALGLSTVVVVGVWVRSRIRRALKDVTFVPKTTPSKSGSSK